LTDVYMRNERKSCSEAWLEKKIMRSLYSSDLEVLIAGYYLVTELIEIFLISLFVSAAPTQGTGV